MPTAFRLIPAALVLSALIMPAPPAMADVLIEEKSSFDGFGSRGWGASETQSSLRLSGERMQQESKSRMTGKMLKFMPGMSSSHTGSITRLDRKMLYSIDYESRTYMEMPLEQIGRTATDAMDQIASQPPPEESEEVPEVSCEPVQLSVKETGGKETIAGFEAREHLVSGRQTCTNQETGETCTMAYDVAIWSTEIQGDLLTEIRDFTKRQVEAMGFDSGALRSQAAAAAAFIPGGSSGMESAIEQMSRIEGYPVRTSFEIFTEGDCGGTGAAGAEDSGDESAMAKSMKGMKKFFSGLKRKKKDDSEAEPGKAETPAAPGRTKVFGLRTEILSLSPGPVPAGIFEIPEGFKKREMQPPPGS